MAELTQQQKKELFLKAREDLFPTSISTFSTRAATYSSQQIPPVVTPPAAVLSASSVQKKKEILSAASSSKKSASSSNQKRRTTRESSSSNALEKTQSSVSKVHFATSSSHHTSLSQQSISEFKKQYSKQPSDYEVHDNVPIRVVKSGYQRDEGLVPPSDPSSDKKGFFSRQYRYLTPLVRRAIDGASVRRGRWKYIIIHNSGTRQGNARVFDIYHRRVRHMQNGLAYHFVIGNGRSSGNGQIEVGHRWRKQVNGGHVASDYLNNIAIGICLVGDYNRDSPSSQQLAALEELVSYLRGRVGRFKGRLTIVLGHREINPKPTDCPGKKFPLRWLRQKFS